MSGHTGAGRLFDLTGRVALVNGASRGIGAATAALLAAHGARVVVTSRKAEGVERVAQDIVEAGGEALPLVCHGGDTQSIESTVAAVVERLGGLDILVNNAAANPYFGPILDTDLASIDKTIEVNLRGFFYFSMLAGRVMRERGGGAIVNVASINGVRPAPLQGIYSVTKAAVISMTQAFARECAEHGIRVNAVLPGLTETRFASALTQDERMLARILPMIPMHRVAQPDEIAPAILFLASDAGSYLTGACLPVDGGMLA